MAEFDLSKMSLSELRDLMEQVSNRYVIVEAGARAEEAERQLRLSVAIDKLNGLLGPVGSTANQNSIRGVLAFGDTIIQQNPGTAVVLIMHGLEEIVKTMVDLAEAMTTK